MIQKKTKKYSSKGTYLPYKKRDPNQKYNSNKKNNYSTTVVVKGPNIVPDIYVVKLKYVNTTSLSSTSGAQGLNQYRANGPYECFFTGTTGQPSGFDQLAQLYGYYTVTGSRCKVKFTGGSAQLGDDLVLVPTLVSSLAGGTTNDKLMQLPYAKRYIGNSNNGSQTAMIDNYITTAKIWGEEPETVISDDTFSADTSSAVPATQWFWNLSYQSLNRSSTQTIYYIVEIDYYMRFYGRRQIYDA